MKSKLGALLKKAGNVICALFLTAAILTLLELNNIQFVQADSENFMSDYNLNSTGILHADITLENVSTTGQSNNAAVDDSSIKISSSQYIKFSDVDFGDGFKRLMGMVSSSASSTLEFRAESTNGQLISTLNLSATKEATSLYTTAYGQDVKYTFEEKYSASDANVKGVKDLYVVCTQGEVNVDWILFSDYDGITNETEEQADARLKWWDEAKFGQFIHFGPYAYLGGYYNNKYSDYTEWIMHNNQISKEDYAKDASKPFNPVDFDAKKIVETAVKAGQKYLVFTSKHHDGFSMYDTKIRDFKDYGLLSDTFNGQYMKNENPKDFVKELSEECKKAGIVFGFYYTIMDWYTPYQAVGTNREPGDVMLDKAAYNEEMKGQLRELIEDYGADILWFDGEWKDWWTEADGLELYEYLRTIKPSTIINNRIGKRNEDAVGDFGTPEQEIPSTGLDHRWETCMTINNSWGYSLTDKNWKTSNQLLSNLTDTVSKGGNFLLNIGPDADGNVPRESVKVLEDMGNWISKYKESIYGTTASKFGELPSGIKSATKGNTAYFFLGSFNGTELLLPNLKNDILSLKLFGQSEELTYTKTLSQLYITLPENVPIKNNVLVMITDGEVIEPITKGNLARGATTTASGFYPDGNNYHSSKAVDGNTGSRWADLDNNAQTSWIKLDLGAAKDFNKFVIKECSAFGERIASYTVEISNDNQNWVTVAQGLSEAGIKLGGQKTFTDQFQTVKARYILLTAQRASINGVRNGVTIYEIEVMEEVGGVKIESPTASSVQLSSEVAVEGTSLMANKVNIKYEDYTYSAMLNPNNGNWFFVIAGVTSGTKTIKVYAYDIDNQLIAMDTVTFTKLDIDQYGENIAFNKNVYASTYIAGYNPSYAIDSNGGSRWAPSDSDKMPWLLIDLGEAKTFNTIAIAEMYDSWNLPNSYRANNYRIQVSTNGTDWATVFDNSEMGALKIIQFEKVSAQYIKLVMTKALYTNRGAPSLYEVMVYNSDLKLESGITGIKIGNQTINFNESKLNYNVTLPKGTETIPEIVVNTADNAIYKIFRNGLNGATYIVSQTNTGKDVVYTFTFDISDKNEQNPANGCKSTVSSSMVIAGIALLGAVILKRRNNPDKED